MESTSVDNIKQIAYSVKDSEYRDQTREIMMFCLTALQTGNITSINTLLKDLNVDELSPIACMVFLRSLFAYRNSITEWEPFRQRVFISVEKRQIPDIKNKFIGLIDIDNKPSPWAKDFDKLLNIHPSIQR